MVTQFENILQKFKKVISASEQSKRNLISAEMEESLSVEAYEVIIFKTMFK